MSQEELSHLLDKEYQIKTEEAALRAVMKFNKEMCVEDEVTASFCLMKLMAVCADALARNVGHDASFKILKDLEEVVKQAPNPKPKKPKIIQ